MIRLIGAILGCLLIVGCAKTELSNEDIAAQKREFSKENYDKIMKEKGNSQQLEEQNRDAAERQRDEQTR